MLCSSACRRFVLVNRLGRHAPPELFVHTDEPPGASCRGGMHLSPLTLFSIAGRKRATALGAFVKSLQTHGFTKEQVCAFLWGEIIGVALFFLRVENIKCSAGWLVLGVQEI